MHLPIILPIFFLSGMAGLLLEVVWVREFGLIFGNTIHSAALVTGVFLGGLGLGGCLGGVVADRVHGRDPLAVLRLYAVCESGIAALALWIAWVLPRLQDVSSAFSSYRAGAAGFYDLTVASHLIRYGVAAGLILPATLLMGATLTLLLRFVVGTEIDRTGWRVGLLYGLNTAGAACGCLLVDVVWIPRLGIGSTQILAAGLDLIAAAGGFWLLARGRRTEGRGPEARGAAARAKRPRAASPLWAAAAALILTGFAAMGTEILWFRFLTSALGQYRLVFSLLLAVVLVGIWLGSMAGGYASDRFGAPAVWFAGTQIALALSTLASLWLFDLGAVQNLVRERLTSSPLGIGLLAEMSIHLAAIVEVVGLPSFFMGAAYPLANAMVQDREGSVGRRAGWLYLANAAGSVTGSTATGFLLLPALGMKWSLFALMIGVLLSLVPVAVAARREPLGQRDRRRPALALICGLGVAIVALAAWSRLPGDGLLLRSFRAAARPAVRDALRPPFLVATSEGPLESILILDVPGQGRTLYTNGHPMSSTAPGEQRYMRAFVHLPLLHDDAPESVLVICFGVGNTAHAASLHRSLRRIEVVDISRHVLEQADFFSATNGRVLHDPRVSVFVNDGRHHLKMQAEGRYDLITLEPPPINFSGVASLYSEEFYALARSRLRPGGFLSQWLPVPQVPPETVRSMIRAFIDVFPGSLLLNGDAGNFILVGRKDRPIELDPAALERRLAAEPQVRDDLRRIQMGSPTEIFGAFAADARHLLAATARSGPLTDDLPLIEYGRIYRPRTGIPADLFDVSRVSVWCPRCFAENGAAAEVADLRTYLGIMSAFYSRSQPAVDAPGTARLPPAWRSALDPASMARTLEESPYLRRLRGDR